LHNWLQKLLVILDGAK